MPISCIRTTTNGDGEDGDDYTNAYYVVYSWKFQNIFYSRFCILMHLRIYTIE